MKKINLYKSLLFSGSLLVLGGLSSCTDFLTIYPTNQVTDEEYWEDKSALESVLGAGYTTLASTDVMTRLLFWGELRSDNFINKSESNETIRNLMNANLLPTESMFKWGSFYSGINCCNKVLEHGEAMMTTDPSFGEGDWAAMKAEATALRSLYYFYLVRSFRDVPFVTKSVDTDEQALAQKVPQTASQVILTSLITDLEAVKDNGMVNYGSAVFNKGRFTKNGIYTLLADVYLWRASKNSSADSVAKYGDMAKQDYQRCSDLCDVVIQNMKEEALKNNKTDDGQSSSSLGSTYPLIQNPLNSTPIQDKAYNTIFGDKNSSESIFEVEFDGTKNKNSTVGYFGSFSNGSFTSGSLGASTILQSVATKADETSKVYSQTDMRQWENVHYTGTSQTEWPLCKYVFKNVSTSTVDNVTPTSTFAVTYNFGRTTQDANWIIYRLSDVMLMKAEALAQISAEGSTGLETAFNLVNAVFKRSNPKLSDANGLLYTNYSTPAALSALVLRERHREFLCEGKRWFDLVRMAERNGNTKDMLTLLVAKYTTNSTAIKAKLASLNSLYNPVNKDEIKANPALIQNPAWITAETVVKN